MNTQSSHPHTVTNTGYPQRQMAKALATALDHADPDTRQRATHRAQQWQHVVDDMANGTLAIGSPAPVSGLPRWVTPHVLHGGFATHQPAAGGPLQPHEDALLARLGWPNCRLAVFAYYLTEAGLAELNAMLDTGNYRIGLPEEAALLTLAWLLRIGDDQAAAQLFSAIAPFAETLRFAPRPGRTQITDLSRTWRYTANEVRTTLAAKRPNPRIETQREALLVWKPFGDELLALWLRSCGDDGRVATRLPQGWFDTASDLMMRYTQLARDHTLCSKHRKGRGNLGTMRAALEDILAGRPLSNQRRGLLQCAIDGMIARRGRPGSEQLAELRARQAQEAQQPSHHLIAQVLMRRLDALPQNEGIGDVADVTRPIEASDVDPQRGRDAVAIPVGWPIPPVLAETVAQGRAASAEELIGCRIVPSAEVLAQLMPPITAVTAAAVYPDPHLRDLMAATYLAFRNRRSLLLINLHHQTTVGDLPWVAALQARRELGDEQRAETIATLKQIAELAVGSFPATILPNPFIRELSTLARNAELDLPLTEELAADIFMGTFTQKFANAALIAADLLAGSIYDRYYGIDYPRLASILREQAPQKRDGFHAHESLAFAELCRSRAHPNSRGYSVAANGMVIEQSQILTTHNLATLVHTLNARPRSWMDLVGQTYTEILRLVERVPLSPTPLPVIKDAAYAWRQLLFFLSMAAPADQRDFSRWAMHDLLEHNEQLAVRMEPVVTGLNWVVDGGGSLDTPDAPGRRFTGWSDRGHWMYSPKTPR